MFKMHDHDNRLNKHCYWIEFKKIYAWKTRIFLFQLMGKFFYWFKMKYIFSFQFVGLSVTAWIQNSSSDFVARLFGWLENVSWFIFLKQKNINEHLRMLFPSLLLTYVNFFVHSLNQLCTSTIANNIFVCILNAILLDKKFLEQNKPSDMSLCINFWKEHFYLLNKCFLNIPLA